MNVAIAILFELCFGVVSVRTQSTCPGNFIQKGENCFGISNTEATWAGAIGYCKSMNAHLASVQDDTEQSFLETHIQSMYNETNITLSTKNDYHYHYLHDLGVDVSGHTSITFQVKACHDAHVALSQDKGVDNVNTYEIVIGGWADQMSVIRDCKQCAHMDTTVHHHQHPTSCTVYKPFWVSWADHIIRVGYGNIVGKQQFLVWNDTMPHPVNYVAVATGFGSDGAWLFEEGSIRPGLFWVGATDLAVEGEWMWLPSQESLEYTNWAPGEPDNSQTRENCAVIDLHKGYKWTDDNCEERRNFICEIEL